MKKILICAATDLELTPIKKSLTQFKNIKYFVHQVGVPLSIYYLNEYLNNNKFDLIIQIGICGSFTKEYNLENVALIQKECFGDMGICEHNKFTNIFEMGFMKPNQKPFKNTWLINSYINKFNFIKLPKVNAITVQQISTDKKIIKLFKEKYNCHFESMEGASLHFVCLEKKIPFLQIRAVSNFVGERDMEKWKIKGALKNLSIEIFKIIDKIV